MVESMMGIYAVLLSSHKNKFSIISDNHLDCLLSQVKCVKKKKGEVSGGREATTKIKIKPALYFIKILVSQ